MGSRGSSSKSGGNMAARLQGKLNRLDRQYYLASSKPVKNGDNTAKIAELEKISEQIKTTKSQLNNLTPKTNRRVNADAKKEALDTINERIANLPKERYAERRAKLVSIRKIIETSDVYNSAPKGWRKIDGAVTAPKGYTWYSNGKSRFGGEFKQALVKNN